jgi:hypothetical protein
MADLCENYKESCPSELILATQEGVWFVYLFLYLWFV